MNAIELAKRTFLDTIDGLPPEHFPDDLKRVLKTHERMKVLLGNLADQFSSIPGIKKETVISATRDMTRIFANAAKAAKDQQIMSVVRKLQLAADIEKSKMIEREAQALEKKGADYVTSEKGLEEIHTRVEVTEAELA